MKGSTLKELLRLNQNIMIQQQLKIATLLSIVEETIQYGRKKNDLQLGSLLDKGLKKLQAFDASTKLATAEMKALKVRIEEENKQESL